MEIPKIRLELALSTLKKGGFTDLLKDESPDGIVETHNSRCNVTMILFVKNGLVTAISIKVNHSFFSEKQLREIEAYEGNAILTAV